MSGWVTQGAEVASFEQEFARYVDARHACAVSSGTAALHLALRAVGVTPGGEVITVSHSHIATANSIRYCGARPVFVDIDPATYNIDTRLIEPAITDRTQAILCVHQMGMPCHLPAILDIAHRRSLKVVEDAACAIGSEIVRNRQWERVGKPHGDVACFSFHPRKLVTTGDGGMLTTRSAELDAKFRLWRQHSMNVPDTVRHTASRVVFEGYAELGYNYRLSDVQAAIGREQLKRLAGVVKRRRLLACRYDRLLATIPGIQTVREPRWARTNWQSYPVRLPQTAGQRTIMQFLLDRGIATRRGVMCAHREPAYSAEAWGCAAQSCACGPRCCAHLPCSEEAQDRTVLLPLFHQMTAVDQDRVVDALRAALASSALAELQTLVRSSA
jgi:dTDP-4-amino-4,6-dideoxygalactose transaminase